MNAQIGTFYNKMRVIVLGKSFCIIGISITVHDVTHVIE